MAESHDNTENIECVNGGISKPKRKAISLALKKKIISLYESGYGPSFIARDLNFSISTISSILKDRARIKEHLKGSISLDSAMITRRRSLAICEMEKQLLKWIEQEAKLGKKLTQSCIQKKAYIIYDEIYLRFGDESKIFAASPGWFRRFKTRSKCSISDEGSKSMLSKKPVDLVEKFWKNLFKDTTYDGKRIFKLIESDFYWRKLPASAHNLDNAAEVFTQKDDEELVSLLLCGNINGDFKHKPLLIFPSHKEEFDDLDGFDLPLLYKVNKDSEFTKDLFHDWFSTSFAPAVEQYCENENIPNKILLVVNQSKWYENVDELNSKHPNINLVVLPNENIADQRSFDRYFTLYFKSYYLQSILVQAIEESENNANFSFLKHWINYDIYQAIYNIEKAWNEMNVKFLVAMCTFDVVRVLMTAETDKSEKIEEILEQIIQLANELKIKMTKDNVMNLIDGVNKEKKEKIIVVLNAVNQVVDVTKVEDASATGSKPTGFNSKELTMAFYEISSAMRRLQRMDDDTQRFLEVKQRIQEALMYYRKMLVFKKD